MADEFNPADIDVHSITWRTVRAWAESEIEKDHIVNETPGLETEETEGLRGGIVKLRNLIKLPDTPEIITQDDPHPGY